MIQLSPKEKVIKDKKTDEITSRLVDKIARRDRLIVSHQIEVQKLQDEIDELTVIQNALAALK